MPPLDKIALISYLFLSSVADTCLLYATKQIYSREKMFVKDFNILIMFSTAYLKRETFWLNQMRFMKRESKKLKNCFKMQEVLQKIDQAKAVVGQGKRNTKEKRRGGIEE